MKIKVKILKYFLITLGFILNFNYSYSQNEIELFNLYKNQDFKSAESLIYKTINLYPNDPKVYFVSGNVYFELNKFEEAISMYTKSNQIDTNFIYGKVNQGIILAITGRSSQALQLFTELNKDPNINLEDYIDLSKKIFIKQSLNDDTLKQDDKLYKKILELKCVDKFPLLIGKADKEPSVDLVKLSKLIVYPKIARMQDIEGRVIVRVLIEPNGKIRKYFVESSDNDLLNQAALDAIQSYGQFEPAIVKGKPIMCWLSIPITFRLN